jgi:hypothetical protein
MHICEVCGKLYEICSHSIDDGIMNDRMVYAITESITDELNSRGPVVDEPTGLFNTWDLRER